MITTFKSEIENLIKSNNIAGFDTLISSLHNIDHLPRDIENLILLNHKHDFILILIKYNKLSKFAEHTLSGTFNNNNKIAIILKNI